MASRNMDFAQTPNGKVLIFPGTADTPAVNKVLGVTALNADGSVNLGYLTMTGGGGSDTAAQILAKLITVDGSGSGLDADLLDGQSSAAFLALTGGTMTGPLTLARDPVADTEAATKAYIDAASNISTGVSRLSYNLVSTTTPPPSSGTFRMNNATPASVTAIYVNKTTTDGLDAANIFAMLTAGGQLYLQNWTNAAQQYTYNVTGTPTDGGTYVTIPVTWNSGAGTIPTGKCMVRLVTALQVGVDRNKAKLQAQWVTGAIVSNDTVWLAYDAPYAGTINALTYFTANGSFSVAVQINGVSVTGLGAVAVSSATPTTTNATAANTFAAGQRITAVITAATGSPTDALLSLAVTWS